MQNFNDSIKTGGVRRAAGHAFRLVELLGGHIFFLLQLPVQSLQLNFHFIYLLTFKFICLLQLLPLTFFVTINDNWRSCDMFYVHKCLIGEKLYRPPNRKRLAMKLPALTLFAHWLWCVLNWARYSALLAQRQGKSLFMRGGGYMLCFHCFMNKFYSKQYINIY